MLIRSSTSHNLTISGNMSNLGIGTAQSPKFAEASQTIKSIQVSPKK